MSKNKETQRKKWIWFYLQDNKIWQIFTIVSILYSFLIIVPFVSYVVNGDISPVLTLIGIIVLFIFVPFLFAISPGIYFTLIPPKEEEEEN